MKSKESKFTSDKNEDDYFSIQITIPNGKERILRICQNDDPEEVAENFCKIYGLKDEIKQRFTKIILHLINLYLNKQVDDSQESQTQQEINDKNDNLDY